MESSIKKAIKGGYEPCEFKPYDDISFERRGAGMHAQWLWIGNKDGEKCGMDFTKIFLDPLFWQALGKAEEWSTSCFHIDDEGSWNEYRHKASCEKGKSLWLLKWHGFIDHLAKGMESDIFFTDLLK